MKFRIIKSYKDLDSGKAVPHVNVRLEYFYHCWEFLLSENNQWFFFADEKLESHRSLFTKIRIQLDKNRVNYPKQLKLFLVGHSYFDPTNILLRDSKDANRLVKEFSTYFHSKFVASSNRVKKDEKSIFLKKVKKDIFRIEKYILGRTSDHYIKRVLNQLVRILHHDNPINESVKGDIKFLVNATIIELYHFGYSLEYLKALPEILLYPRFNSGDFPFTKNYTDFKDNESYREYQQKELKDINLRKQLKSLLNLVNRPRLKGYYIFQVDNFNFLELEPLKIWDVVFYNPQISKQLSYDGLDAESSKHVEEIEKYWDQDAGEKNDETKGSNCNAVVSIEYRPLHWNRSDNTIISAMEKVNNSLHVLKRMKYTYSGGRSTNVVVNPSSYILASNKFEYRSSPRLNAIIGEERPFQITEEQRKLFLSTLKWINRLDSTIDFHKRMMDICSTYESYKLDIDVFSFKDFWIKICDPLFPNDPIGLTAFCKKCLRQYLERKFLTNAKILLHDSLRFDFLKGKSHYWIDDKVKKSIGLEILLLKPISIRKFQNHYSEIKQYIDCEFLNDLIGEIDKFLNNRTKYLEEADEWIERTINEIFAERNLEVHNNISTDMSLIKLRKSAISIANIMIQSILLKTHSRTRLIEDLDI